MSFFFLVGHILACQRNRVPKNIVSVALWLGHSDSKVLYYVSILILRANCGLIIAQWLSHNHDPKVTFSQFGHSIEMCCCPGSARQRVRFDSSLTSLVHFRVDFSIRCHTVMNVKNSLRVVSKWPLMKGKQWRALAMQKKPMICFLCFSIKIIFPLGWLHLTYKKLFSHKQFSLLKKNIFPDWIWS